MAWFSFAFQLQFCERQAPGSISVRESRENILLGREESNTVSDREAAFRGKFLNSGAQNLPGSGNPAIVLVIPNLGRLCKPILKRNWYNRKPSDILELQDEISRKVSEQLSLKLTGKQKE